MNAAAAKESFTCPLCSKCVKVNKRTKAVARHGHRRAYGSEWNSCPTSGLSPLAAHTRALEVLESYRALTEQCREIKGGRERKIFPGVARDRIKQIDKDIARVKAALEAIAA